jgi:hypothetical protein
LLSPPRGISYIEQTDEETESLLKAKERYEQEKQSLKQLLMKINEDIVYPVVFRFQEVVP